jgi:hypothetical protein
MSGIFNPFEKPKEKLPTYDQAQEKLEKEREALQEELCDAALDGGGFVLKILQVRPEDIYERLGRLIKDVVKVPELKAELERYGVTLTNDKIAEACVSSLKTSSGYLGVNLGDKAHSETAVYNRLARALYNVPIKKTLTDHNAVIIKRG